MIYDSTVFALEAPWIITCWSHLEDQRLWDVTATEDSLHFRQKCGEVFALLNGVGYRARHIITAHTERSLGVSPTHFPLIT